MNIKSILNIRSLGSRLSSLGPKLRPYLLPVFLLFVALLYGFLVLRINSLAGTQPSQTDVSTQVKAARLPRIDEAVVKQLQALQDNSVSVRALFNQARNNPFQ